MAYRYDVKDTSESPARLPPRQHASTGENTSFDTLELLTIGEDRNLCVIDQLVQSLPGLNNEHFSQEQKRAS